MGDNSSHVASGFDSMAETIAHSINNIIVALSVACTLILGLVFEFLRNAKKARRLVEQVHADEVAMMSQCSSQTTSSPTANAPSDS